MDSVTVKLIDLGVIDGAQTFQVLNADTGEVIGYNQTEVETL
jgi:hypothetical protein